MIQKSATPFVPRSTTARRYETAILWISEATLWVSEAILWTNGGGGWEGDKGDSHWKSDCHLFDFSSCAIRLWQIDIVCPIPLIEEIGMCPCMDQTQFIPHNSYPRFPMSLASFLNQNDYKVFGPMDFYYYFNTHHSFPGGKESPVDREHFDWENELLSKDVLIIEVSSTLVHEAGYGFVESALEALGADPDVL